MARFPELVRRRILEIEAELSTMRDGGPGALAMFTPLLEEVAGAEVSISFVLGPRGEGLTVEGGAASGLPSNVFSAFDGFLKGRTIGWTNYNPVRPEPDQRNVALAWPQIQGKVGGRAREDVPVVRELFPRYGLARHDNLRVLVCDGPSLLAWVGAFRPGSFDPSHRRALQRLVPALRHRLMAERLLAGEPRTRAMLDAAFAAIPAPAFFTDANGTLLEVNPAGRVWLDRDPSEVRAALRVAAMRPRDPRFSVTRIVAPGAPEMRLAVLRPLADPRLSQCAAHAAQRWSFTPRQTQILAILVEGVTTRTLAAALGIAERTVEVHLTAMFHKAQVESRAELVAAVRRRSWE